MILSFNEMLNLIISSDLCRQLNLKKVLVTGGYLDHKVDPQVLNEGGGEKVCILALDEAGRVSGSIFYLFPSIFSIK